MSKVKHLGYTNNHRKNITIYWQQFFPNWFIPQGYHVHHIYPKSLCKQDGWTNEQTNHPKNLIALHPDDHWIIHKCRGDIVTCNFIKIIGHLKGKKSTRLGYTHSEETKYKIGIANKGKPSSKGMLGKKHTKKSKAKISNSSKGRTNSDESISKMKETKADLRWKETTGVEMKRKISETKLDLNWKKTVGYNRDRKVSKKLSILKNSIEWKEGKGKDVIQKYKDTVNSKEWNEKRLCRNNKISEIQHSEEWKQKYTFTCPYCDKTMTGKGVYNRWHGDNCRSINPN